VLGAGTIGLLATMALRNRGLDVVTLGLQEPPYRNSELIAALGATYLSTRQVSLSEAARARGRADLVFECTGYSPIIFDAARNLLGKNGVLVLASVTGGSTTTEVESDALNLEFVLGNKVMVGTVNANREHFEEGVRDMALTAAQVPDWLPSLLTHRVEGLESWPEAFRLLGEAHDAIKIFVEVAPL
jgi:threonine dehydrogenase-like Zn-dependent dehydrogenase